MPGLLNALGCTSAELNMVWEGTNCGSWFSDVLDCDAAGLFEDLAADRDDRAGRLEVAAHDARTGDGHFGELFGLRLQRQSNRRLGGNAAEYRGDGRADRHVLE